MQHEDDEMNYDENRADFFETTNCSIILLGNDIDQTIWCGQKIQILKVWTKMFSPHEKDKCSMMMKAPQRMGNIRPLPIPWFQGMILRETYPDFRVPFPEIRLSYPKIRAWYWKKSLKLL